MCAQTWLSAAALAKRDMTTQVPVYSQLPGTHVIVCRQQLAAEANRTEAAAVAAAEADVVWQEVLMQTEEDLEKRAQTDSERLATLQRTAEEVGRPRTTAALKTCYGC